MVVANGAPLLPSMQETCAPTFGGQRIDLSEGLLSNW